jgi:hypothetical protein
VEPQGSSVLARVFSIVPTLCNIYFLISDIYLLKDHRNDFLNGKGYPNDVEETRRLENEFEAFVKNSNKWWGGDWPDNSDIVKWLVGQYLKRRKPSKLPAFSL